MQQIQRRIAQMINGSRAGLTFKTVILMLSSLALIACAADQAIVMPESKVQRMHSGELANFDGYLLTDSALAKLLEKAESCKQKQ